MKYEKCVVSIFRICQYIIIASWPFIGRVLTPYENITTFIANFQNTYIHQGILGYIYIETCDILHASTFVIFIFLPTKCYNISFAVHKISLNAKHYQRNRGIAYCMHANQIRYEISTTNIAYNKCTWLLVQNNIDQYKLEFTCIFIIHSAQGWP